MQWKFVSPDHKMRHWAKDWSIVVFVGHCRTHYMQYRGARQSCEDVKAYCTFCCCKSTCRRTHCSAIICALSSEARCRAVLSERNLLIPHISRGIVTERGENNVRTSVQKHRGVTNISLIIFNFDKVFVTINMVVLGLVFQQQKSVKNLSIYISPPFFCLDWRLTNISSLERDLSNY